MPTEIFLIAPLNANADTFPATLSTVVAAAPVAALLLPRADKTLDDYKHLVAQVLPVAQAAGVAVLLDDLPDLVRALGADGVHMTTGAKAVAAVANDLRPDFIVGAGAIHSRHEAMLRGEHADYVMFGALAGAVDDTTREETMWWADTFEVPGVYCQPDATAADVDPTDCEFIGLGGGIWNHKDGPATALKAIAYTLGITA